MTTEPRIRPRLWMAMRRLSTDAPARSRLRRTPLSLIFRRQRKPARVTAAPIGKAAAAITPVPILRLERHVHHTHEGARVSVTGGRDIVHSTVRTATLRTVQQMPGVSRLSPAREVQVQSERHSIRFDHLTHRDRLTNVQDVQRVPAVEHHTWTPFTMARAFGAPHTEGLRRPLDRPATEFRHAPITSRPQVFLAQLHHRQVLPMETMEIVRRVRPASVEHRLDRAAQRPNVQIGERTLAFRSHAPRPDTVPIVWRNQRRDEARAESESSAGYAPGNSSRTPAGLPHSRDEAPAAAPAPAAIPAPVALNLDRLAEDVMRRIDKRTRIERERRGMA